LEISASTEELSNKYNEFSNITEMLQNVLFLDRLKFPVLTYKCCALKYVVVYKSILNNTLIKIRKEDYPCLYKMVLV
jgi:hypothetical protein